MNITTQHIVDVTNVFIDSDKHKIASISFEHFDLNNDGYVDMHDLMNVISSYSSQHRLSNLQENKMKDFISEAIFSKTRITLRDFEIETDVTFNEEIIHSIGGKELELVDIRALRNEQRQNLNMDWMDLRKNPVVKDNLKVTTNKFKTASGEAYIRGNSLYDKYDGEYHVHRLGDICAGPHDMSHISPERTLYIDELYNKHDINIQVQNMIVDSLQMNSEPFSDIDIDLPFDGVTSYNLNHRHGFRINRNRTVTIHQAVHPEDGRINHKHNYVGLWPNGIVTENKSACHPHCREIYGVAGVGHHNHNLDLTQEINNISKLNPTVQTTSTTSTRNYVVDNYLFPVQWHMTEWEENDGSGPEGNPSDECLFLNQGGFYADQPTFFQCNQYQSNFRGSQHLKWSRAIEEFGFGQHEPIVAIIDSGFDIEHQDLVNKLWTCPPDGNNGACEPGTHGYSMYHDSPHPPFYHETYAARHGTAVASLVGAGVGDSGIVGMCPNCRLMILHVNTSIGGNSVGNSSAEALREAIRFAVDNGARVINHSDSYKLPDSDYVNNTFLPAAREGVQYAFDNNVLFVSAGGNDPQRISEPFANGGYTYPALWPETFAVGAWQDMRTNFFFSPLSGPSAGMVTNGNTFGVELEVSAPGMRVIAASTLKPYTFEQVVNGEDPRMNQWHEAKNIFNDEGMQIATQGPDNSIDGWLPDLVTDSLYTQFSGTSCAAPLVSGLAGLLLSHNPELTLNDLKNIITSTADDITYPGKQERLEYMGGFDTEIDFYYPFYLPYFPYSTSISREEIPPTINVHSALTRLYEGLPGDANTITEVIQLVDLLLNYDYESGGSIPAIPPPQCIGAPECNSIPEEICQPEYAGEELSLPPHDPPQWPSEWGCAWVESDEDYSMFDFNNDGVIDVYDLMSLISDVLTNDWGTD